MLRRGADGAAHPSWRKTLAPMATVLSIAVCAVAIVLSPADRVDTLSVILGVAAIGAGVLVAGDSGGLAVSSSMIVFVLAAAFLGPASAVAAAVIVRGRASKPADDVTFYLAVVLACVVAHILSFVTFVGTRRLVFPEATQFGWRTLLEFLPGAALSLMLVVAGVGITFKVGNAGIAFAL